MERVNIFGAENLEGRVDAARALGSTATTMFIYDLAPGQGQCPYHYEYEEEWLLVVDGTIVVRAPDGEHTLERGDLVCFPSGPAGAHKLMNRSESPARTLMFSRRRVPAVSVYPDSDKIGVWPGNDADDLIFRRGTAVGRRRGGWDRASDELGPRRWPWRRGRDGILASTTSTRSARAGAAVRGARGRRSPTT